MSHWQNFSAFLVLFTSSLITSLDIAQATTLELEQKAKVSGVVWAMAEIDPETLIFTLREGRAGLLSLSKGNSKGNSTSNVQWLTGLPEVSAQGQGGLLDVAVHHNWIYFTYSKPGSEGARTTLARAKLEFTRLTQWQDLLVTQSATNTGRHFGSRIAFDGKGHVFFGVGDRGERPNGQDLTTHAGSILRLNLDGSVPKDNPFVNQSGALPEIWSYGHRNPQGLCFNPQTQRLWSSEHGPRGGDEINLIEPGKNYGWAEVSHGKEYWNPLMSVGEATSKQGMEDPRYVYIPSIAPGSLLCYRGERITQWKNHLLLGALKLAHLNSVEIDNQAQLRNEQRWFEDKNQRIRSLMQNRQGQLFMGTDSGHIYAISPR